MFQRIFTSTFNRKRGKKSGQASRAAYFGLPQGQDLPMLRTKLVIPDYITRSVGFLSCVVGLLCYALSLSFKSLFGEWNPTKIVIYASISSVISIVVLFAGKNRVSGVFKLMLKAHVEFLVLMLTSLYSFFADQSMKGKPDTLTVVSSGAFALTSLCLSQQIELGFQVGLFNFFLGCLTVQLMKIHFIFILVAAGFSYPLVILRSYPESESTQNEGISEQVSVNSDASVADYQRLEILTNNANKATATMNEGISEQVSVNSDAPFNDQLLEILTDNAHSATATKDEGISEQIARGNEGSASHGEGNGNKGEHGSVHENPNNLSRDQLVAHYESVMSEMTEAHELQVEALNEKIRTLETLRRRRGLVSNDVGGEALTRRTRPSFPSARDGGNFTTF